MFWTYERRRQKDSARSFPLIPPFALAVPSEATAKNTERSESHRPLTANLFWMFWLFWACGDARHCRTAHFTGQLLSLSLFLSFSLSLFLSFSLSLFLSFSLSLFLSSLYLPLNFPFVAPLIQPSCYLSPAGGKTTKTEPRAAFSLSHFHPAIPLPLSPARSKTSKTSKTE